MFITEITISGITDRDIADELSSELSKLINMPVLVTLPDRDFTNDEDGYFTFSPTESAVYKFISNKKIDRSLIDKFIFKLRLTYENVEVTSFGVQASSSCFDVDVLSSFDPVNSPKKL